MHNIISISRN